MMSVCIGGLGDRDRDTTLGRITGAVSLWSWEMKQEEGLTARKPEGAGRSAGLQLEFWTCRQEMGRQEMGTAEDLGTVCLEAITIIRTLDEMPGGELQTELRRQNKENSQLNVVC